MYKVLVVDDEEPAHETLKCLINWEETPFRIASTAKNGKEALEKYAALKPELIITDIQMPVIDGLELIRKIRAENKDQKFVILSCHENFSYAKEAIKYGVSDYLLKDLLTPQDLYNLLEKIRNEIENEDRFSINKYNSEAYNFYTDFDFNENLYRKECRNIALQSVAFENLSKKSLDFYIKEFNLNFSTKFYTVLCIVIDDYVRFAEKFDRLEEKYKRYEMLQVIKDTLDEFNGGECFYDEKGTFVAIAGIENTNSELFFISSCHAIANRIHINLMRHSNITVTIGVSSSFSNIQEIKTKYNEAMEVVKYRVFLGKGKTILYNVRFVKAASINPEVLDNILSEIKTCLQKGEIQKVKGLIKRLYDDEAKGFIQYNYLKYVNSQILGIIAQFCRKNNINYSKVFECEHLPVQKLDEFETVEEMSNWFFNVIDRIINLDTVSYGLNYSKHVRDAIIYIRDNYCDKLGLSQISKRLGVNKAYLCRIFKQETGDNLTDYINKVRIEKAKELIVSTNYKVYEVAEKVGFTNAQHFTNVFKKITGQNPLQFRNNNVVI